MLVIFSSQERHNPKTNRLKCQNCRHDIPILSSSPVTGPKLNQNRGKLLQQFLGMELQMASKTILLHGRNATVSPLDFCSVQLISTPLKEVHTGPS